MNFNAIVHRQALAQRVLVVAKTQVEGTWKAYCDSVPGLYHPHEQEQVLDNGDEIREDVARLLFPEFDDLPYAG